MYVLPVVTWLLLQFQVCLLCKITATCSLAYSWLFRTGISRGAVVLVSTVGLHSLWSTTMNVNDISAQAGDSIICVLSTSDGTGSETLTRDPTRPDPTRTWRFSPGDPTQWLSVCALNLNWDIISTTVCFKWMLSSTECFLPKSLWSVQHTCR